MAATVEWFDDWNAADPASRLARAAEPSLFNRADWYRLTETHVLGTPPAILRASAGGRQAWLALRLAGRRADPYASWYSLDFGPLGDHDPALLDALLRALATRAARARFHPLTDTTADALEGALRRTGWIALRSRATTRWCLDCAGQSFEEYWQARAAPLRATVARKSRSHPVRISIAKEFEAEAWSAYEDVYRASWKPAEGSPAFLRALAEQEGAAGTLRLGLARDAGDRPLAAQFWLVENGVATVHKLAHREDARAGSPGTLLSHAMFCAAIDEDRVARIDFGLGDEPYKRDWVDRPEPVWRIDAYRPFTIAGLAGLAREAAGLVRRRLAR